MYNKKNTYAIANTIYFILISLFIVVRIISSTLPISVPVSWFLSMFIQVGLMLCLPLFLYTFLKKQHISQTVKDFSFKKLSLKGIIISIILGVLVYILTIFIASFFSTIINALGYENAASSQTIEDYSVGLLLLNLILTAVLPGFCEEVAHRGMLLHAFKGLGAKKAILFSGLFFGLMHLSINQFFYATLIGFFLGFLVLTTGNIFPAIIIHFMNNAISVLMGYCAANQLWYANIIDNFFAFIGSKGAVFAMLIIFVVIFVCLFLLFYLSFLLFKGTRIAEFTSIADNFAKAQMRNELMQGIESSEQNQETVVIDVSKDDISDNAIKPNFSANGKILSIEFASDFMYGPIKQKPTLRDNMFFYVNMFMTVMITISTFIWGVL